MADAISGGFLRNIGKICLEENHQIWRFSDQGSNTTFRGPVTMLNSQHGILLFFLPTTSMRCPACKHPSFPHNIADNSSIPGSQGSQGCKVSTYHPHSHAHWPSIPNPTRWMPQSGVNDFADTLMWEGQFPGEYCLPHFFSEVLISYPVKQANILDNWNNFHPLLSPDAASRLSSTTNDHSRPLMHAILWGTTTTGREYHPMDMANKLSRTGCHG